MKTALRSHRDHDMPILCHFDEDDSQLRYVGIAVGIDYDPALAPAERTPDDERRIGWGRIR